MEHTLPVTTELLSSKQLPLTRRPRQWAKWLLSFGLLLTGLLGFASVSQGQTFTHPSIPFTNADLNQLRANITRQPWLAGYQALQNDARSQLSYTMQGPFATVSRVPNLNNPQWISDMVAIHNLTFMYVFTNNTAYAQKATNMLDAWATTNTTWGGGENQLDIGDYTPYFVTAADILRGTYPGWTAANTQHVKDYFRNVLLPPASIDYTLRDNNKGALQLQTGLAIAAFLDDRALFEKALEVYRIDAGGGLRASLPNGEVGDTGRDDHWFTEVQALGWSAEVAWKQGYDVFADLNNRLLAIGELYNQYSIAPNTLPPFTPFGGYAAYWTNWGIPPGVRHQSPFNNIIEGAYALRKGIPTPYTTQMRGLVGEGAWSFLYLKSADASTATALPPIAFPPTAAATRLSNVEIGSTGINGSASYAGGIWTLRGAGNSAVNAVNFTNQPVSGDAGIVVKVESNATQAGEVGLMMRATLAPGSDYVAVRLNGNGGVTPLAQGQVANTLYTHGQPAAPWWLKLERVGNRVFTYHSRDGVSWTNNALFIMTLPANTYLGLYTISNNLSQLNTATLSQVAITNTTPSSAPAITSSFAAAGTVGAAFSYATTAANSPTAFSASGLPAGLSINASTGVISGTPTAAGSSAVRVTATNASGAGSAVVVISVSNTATPAAPVATAAVSNVVSIRISWPAVANASSYTVKRALSATGPFATLQAGITALSFTDTNPVPEVPNYYVVTASAGTPESGNSNVVSAAVPPAVPSKPVITNQAAQLSLSWGAVAGAVSYNVKRSTVPGGPYTIIGSPTTNSYTDLSVTPGTGYYYVVSAVGNTQQSANSPEAFGVAGATALTWSPTPASTVFNLANNWVENAVPTSPAILNFGTSTDSVLTNDVAGLAAARLEFTSTARAYSIDGSVLELRNDFINNSTRRQTLSLPLTLNSPVTVDASGPVSFTGGLSGSGRLTKKGNGLLYISGLNTYAGPTVISGPNNTSWPPVSGIEIVGIGTGTPSNPTSGPLGTGRILFDGGSLSTPQAATLYNDLEIPAGKTGVIMETTGALNLYGKFIGSGTIQHDGNTTAGLHLFGDNSAFAGTFVSRLRSGNQRVRFEVPEAGSARAAWLLDANGVDCQGIQFRTGTLHFGSLAGRGYIRNNGGGTPTISIGALNTNTSYGGTMQFFMNVDKVGTGTLIFTGLHNYGGNTTIKGGKFLLNNDPVTGTFISPVIAQAGAFGGTGRSTAPVTIGTGVGPGATLEPGNQAVGTFLTTGLLTMLSDATYAAEISLSAATSDKMTVGSVVLNSPTLTLTALATGALPAGTNFTLIDNTGSNAVTGTFANLPELAAVTVGGYTFRITYRGGTGNDVVLLDNRTVPAMITSASPASGTAGTAFSYTITAVNSPTSFNATGLPAGLSVDTTTGLISGTPTTASTFTVTLSATNANGSGTKVLTLNVGTKAPLPNMVVSSTQNLQGAYNNVTITGPATGGAGVATLSGPLTISGTLTVQTGAVLATNCQPVTGSGSFELQAGGELRICDADGLAGPGSSTGSMQLSGTRTFSPEASYVYNGTAPQITGAGLPSQVRNLTISNASGVVLSSALGVSQVVSLMAGNLTAGNNLTLLSDTAGTAMVVNATTTTNVSGTVTVQRYIEPSLNAGTGYRHYASPVQSASVADLTTNGFVPVVNSDYNTQGNAVTPFPTVFGYDQTRLTATASGFDQGWYSPGALTDLLAPGLGYSVNIPASQTVDFVGTLTNGNISRPSLTYGPLADGGWQLLGNPYPSPLNWDQVGRTNVGGAVHVYHSSGQYAGTYSSYVAGSGGTGTNGGTSQLALGQGFFVRTSTAGAAGTVNFTNTARPTTYSSPVFNRTATSDPLLRLQLRSATGSVDEAVIRFTSGATAGFDASFDAQKLRNVGAAPINLFSLAGPQEMSINTLPLPGLQSLVVPLGVVVPQAGTYTLRADQLLNQLGSVMLRDALTGSLVPLDQQPVYTFTVAAGAPATGRFALLFAPQQVLSTAAAGLSQQVILFPNPAHGDVQLSLPAALQAERLTASLLNALGQVVRTMPLAANAGAIRTLPLAGLATGVYTLRLPTSAGTVTKRLVVE
jgi:autotransporter-associated beta strand protein